MDYDGEHHAGMGNGTHTLLIGAMSHYHQAKAVVPKLDLLLNVMMLVMCDSSIASHLHMQVFVKSHARMVVDKLLLIKHEV